MFIGLCIFQRQLQTNAVDLSKQKALDADPRAIQQIVFLGVVGGNDGAKIRLHYSWKIERNNTRICKKNNKSVVTTYKWLNAVK